ALFHLRHGDIFVLAGDDLAVMAASAGKPCLGNVRIMAESDFRSTFHFEGYSSRLPFMTSGAELFILDAERLHAGMAGAAGLGRLHLRHGKVLLLLHIEDGVMADLAVVLVFLEVQVVAENYRLGIFECERYILGLFGRREHREHGQNDQQYQKTTRFHISLLKCWNRLRGEVVIIYTSTHGASILIPILWAVFVSDCDTLQPVLYNSLKLFRRAFKCR